MTEQNLTASSGVLERLIAGQTTILNGTVTDEAGAALNITGATVSLRISDSARAVHKLTVAGVVVNGPAGTLSATITAAQTTALGAGSYYYQIWLTLAGNSAPCTGGSLSIARACPTA